MIGGISGISPYTAIYQYMGHSRVGAVSKLSHVAGASGIQSTRPAGGTQASGRVQPEQKSTTVMAVGRAANPGVPVESVGRVPAIRAQMSRSAGYVIPFLRQGMDPAELAVRMRIRYVGDSAKEEQEDVEGPETDDTREDVEGLEKDDTKEDQEEKECRTCEQRKYQDGSDDPGVSYQTPTHIAPERAASAVLGHEMEHVMRERVSAIRDGRRIVSQSVTMYTAICPECGKVYVSGGTTRMVTASDPQPE